MKLIDISTPKHPNTFTMVDDEDYDFLNQWKWGLCRGYATRSLWGDEKRSTIYMHLEILKPPPGMLADHRFGNRLDNRRQNLRICTHAENNRNRGPRIGRTLPKGVCLSSNKKRFRAKIKVNNQAIHLGNFPTVPEAEAAYIEATKKYHGEFALVNSRARSNAK